MFKRCFCVSFFLIVPNMCNFASPRHAVKEIAWSHSLPGNCISPRSRVVYHAAESEQDYKFESRVRKGVKSEQFAQATTALIC